MIVITILLSLLVLSIFHYSTIFPQMGKKASGDLLERIKKSQNYRNNIFQNPIETKMDAPPFEAIKQMLIKKTDRIPSTAVITSPIDLKRYENEETNDVLTWLGHSTFLIKLDGITILTDPVFGKRASVFQFIGPRKFKYTNEIRIEDLPKVDIVLISHDHYDHLDYRVIKKLQNTVDKFFIPLGVSAHLEHWGVNPSKIVELDWWENNSFKDIQLTATPARHFSGRTANDRYNTLWCGWAIKSENYSLYFSGDSGYFEGFKEIGEKLGPFDLSMMECGQYSEFWANIHMTPEESVQAAVDLKSKVAIPMHWGKFKLSLHSWHEPPTRFAQKALKDNLKVVLPLIGSTFTFDNLPEQYWWVK